MACWAFLFGAAQARCFYAMHHCIAQDLNGNVAYRVVYRRDGRGLLQVLGADFDLFVLALGQVLRDLLQLLCHRFAWGLRRFGSVGSGIVGADALVQLVNDLGELNQFVQRHGQRQEIVTREAGLGL